jgi:hypothetical protein
MGKGRSSEPDLSLMLPLLRILPANARKGYPDMPRRSRAQERNPCRARGNAILTYQPSDADSEQSCCLANIFAVSLD